MFVHLSVEHTLYSLQEKHDHGRLFVSKIVTALNGFLQTPDSLVSRGLLEHCITRITMLGDRRHVLSENAILSKFRITAP